ncbi:hypothetical protein LTS18_013528, partial [Coniosporium uncinatum]
MSEQNGHAAANGEQPMSGTMESKTPTDMTESSLDKQHTDATMNSPTDQSKKKKPNVIYALIMKLLLRITGKEDGFEQTRQRIHTEASNRDPITMWLQTKHARGERVVLEALIDTGASDNFISLDLAKQLGLTIRTDSDSQNEFLDAN